MEKDVLSKDDLAALQKKLAGMSVTTIHDFYFAAHFRCKYEHGKLPSPRAIQELVAAWKVLRNG